MNPLYIIRGVVQSGEKRGKDLGFPTANIPLTQDIPEGIYAATVTIDANVYQSATFVGSAKTFNKTDQKVESYILDFSEDIYGRQIIVTIYKKIRDNQKFTTVEELKIQMTEDIKKIRDFFKSF